MRVLTQIAQQESERQGQDVIWMMTVEWPDGAVRYAHRQATLADGTALPPTLADPGRLTASPETGIGADARPASSRLRISLMLDGAESPSVRERITMYDPEGLSATWGVIFLDEAGEAAAVDEIVLFRGVIERATQGRFALEMQCLDFLSARGGAKFGRILTAADLPEPGVSEGRMLPWIFGAPGQVELLEWRTGRPLMLARDVSPDDRVIPLASVENLPKSGMVQIGDERLVYDKLDTNAKTLGSESVPLRRTEPAWHEAGSSARLMPTGGFVWLAACHPCRAVRDLRADGLPVEAAQYEVSTESLQGETLQKVVLEKWPTRLVYRPYVYTVRLNGQAQPGIFTLEPSSTAWNGAFAFDEFPQDTKAELHAQAAALTAKWRGHLAGGDRRYGRLTSARLKARVSADRIWEPATSLRLTFQKGEAMARAALPRPTELPATGTRYGPVDFILDLAPLVEADGDWNRLDGSGENGFLARVEIETAGDPVRFFVHDLALEANYRPRGQVVMARRLTAEVEGWEEDGTLLENPSDLVRFFLRDARGFGIEESRLDAASFADARERLDALRYRFSNRLSEPLELGAILRRLLFEARCRLMVSGEKLLLRCEPTEAEHTPPDFLFDKHTILSKTPLRFQRRSEHLRVRAVHLHYGRDFSGAAPNASARRSLWSDRVSSLPVYARSGIEFTDRLHWHNHQDTAVTADLARALLSLHGRRFERAAIAAPLCAIALEPADRVGIADEWFPLNLRQGRVETVSVREPHTLLFHAIFPAEGFVCWKHDAHHFLWHDSSGSLIEFWIAGKPAASIQWDGFLRLRGKVMEEVAFQGAMEKAIEFDADEGRLYFGTGANGVHTPRFALDANGNLLVSGRIAEKSAREDLILTDCTETTADYFAKGIAEKRPVLVYDAPSQRLQLPGTVAEQERFY